MAIKKELITEKDPKSPLSEVFRTLRTNIQFMNTNKKMKTLLITSSYPGEGKSWISSNLAVTFAQTGKKVLLIDADLRKGRQNVIFGVSPKPGLSNCLVDIDLDNFNNFDISKYIQNTDVENLILMPSGNVPPNPSELLLSKQMLKLLETLKSVCDLIIIDGTPCDLVTDSVILSRITDATLIVIAHKETKKEALDRTVKSIQNVGGRIAGVVINKMPISISRYNEKYYYQSHLPNSSKKGKFFSNFHKKNKDKKRFHNRDNDGEKFVEKDDIDNIYNNVFNSEYKSNYDDTLNQSTNDQNLDNKNINFLNNNPDNSIQNEQGFYSESSNQHNQETQNIDVKNNYDRHDTQNNYSVNNDNQNTNYTDKNQINVQNNYSKNNYDNTNLHNYTENNLESETTKQILSKLDYYVDKQNTNKNN